MTLSVSLFCILIESTCTLLLMKSFRGDSLIPDKIDLVFFVIPFMWAPIPDTYSVLALAVGQIVSFFYYMLRTGRKLIPATFLLSATSISLQSIQGLSSILLYPVMKVLPIHYLPPFGCITTLLIIVVVVCLFPCATVYQKIINGNLPLKLLLLNTYLITILITIFYKTHMKDVYEYIVLIFAILFLILFVNICIFYYENQLKEKQRALLIYEKNKPKFETLIGDIRANQHEYDNRIQSIALLANVCKDYDTLRNALKKYTTFYDTRQKCYPLLTLNMPLVTSTLYNLHSMAEKKHLDMFYDIPNPVLQCRISEHIMVDFLHILTQNAIEATEPEGHIYITLLNQADTFYFEVQNPVERFISPEEIEQFFQKGYSTKNKESHSKTDLAAPHGYGLFELLTQVNKLNGTVSADCITQGDHNWIIFTLTL